MLNSGKNFRALHDKKLNILTRVVRQKKSERKKKTMLSPARKNNIALLNFSSQCIVFMEKCISVPHDRKTIFCFPSHEKKIF